MRLHSFPHQFARVLRHALTSLLLLTCLLSVAAQASGLADTRGAATGIQLPDAPLPLPDPALPADKLSESSGCQEEQDLHDTPTLLSLHPRFAPPQTVLETGGRHVPDPLLGRYQANAPPRA